MITARPPERFEFFQSLTTIDIAGDVTISRPYICSLLFTHITINMRWLAIAFTIQVLASLVEAAIMNISNTRGIRDSRYAKAHYLPESHSFNPRDGWEPVNISNLNYKYLASSHKDHSFHRALRRSPQNDTSAGLRTYREKHAKTSNTTTTTGFLGTVVSSLASIFAGCMGKGPSEGVTITWYVISPAPQLI